MKRKSNIINRKAITEINLLPANMKLYSKLFLKFNTKYEMDYEVLEYIIKFHLKWFGRNKLQLLDKALERLSTIASPRTNEVSAIYNEVQGVGVITSRVSISKKEEISRPLENHVYDSKISSVELKDLRLRATRLMIRNYSLMNVTQLLVFKKSLIYLLQLLEQQYGPLKLLKGKKRKANSETDNDGYQEEKDAIKSLRQDVSSLQSKIKQYLSAHIKSQQKPELSTNLILSGSSKYANFQQQSGSYCELAESLYQSKNVIAFNQFMGNLFSHVEKFISETSYSPDDHSKDREMLIAALEQARLAIPGINTSLNLYFFLNSRTLPQTIVPSIKVLCVFMDYQRSGYQPSRSLSI